MGDFDIDACKSKDDLEAYALKRFGVDIDKRQRMDDLKAYVKSLQEKAASEPQPVPEPEPEPVQVNGSVDAEKITTVDVNDLPTTATQTIANKPDNRRFVINKDGGRVVLTSKLKAKLAKGGTEWRVCDAQGNPV